MSLFGQKVKYVKGKAETLIITWLQFTVDPNGSLYLSSGQKIYYVRGVSNEGTEDEKNIPFYHVANKDQDLEFGVMFLVTESLQKSLLHFIMTKFTRIA